jgi:EpsG family
MFTFNFIFTAIISSIYNNKNKNFIVIILIIVLSLFAGTRSKKVDVDYNVYVDLFNEGVANFSNFQFFSVGEPCTYIIPNIINLFTENYIVISIFIFAILGVSLKILTLKKYNFFFLGLMLYTSNLYLIQEMTTIRAGIASGIFLLSINDILEGRDKKVFYKMILAICFHYSSIIFVLIWIILRKKLIFKYYFIGIILSIIIALTKINLLTLFMLDKVFPKVEIYLRALEIESVGELNVFNFRILIAIFIAILLLIYSHKFKENKLFNILIRIHLLSIMIFFVFSQTNMVFSLRLFEMISVIQIVLYPMIIFIFNKKVNFIGSFIVILISIIQFYYLIEVSEIFKEYDSWLI